MKKKKKREKEKYQDLKRKIDHFHGWAINDGLGNNHYVETLRKGENQPSKEVSPLNFWKKTPYNHTQHCFGPLPKL